MKLREEFTCPIELATDLISAKWKTIILWELSRESRRLKDLRKIKNINEKMLIQHLNELLEAGIITKTDYKTYPLRTDYSLTELGRKLLPTLEALQEFGKEFIKSGGNGMGEKIKLKTLELIKKSTVSFIGSISSEGFPDIKAMLAPREINGLKEIFFSTNTSSMRVSQFRENPKASLYFYNEQLFLGVLLEGTMEVITDSSVKKRIWREGDTLYYKNGTEDEDYCVLHFTAKSGRFYENFSSVSFEI
jgi:DNA-binding HxlR family transcriptional regulator/general stress protein 26